MADETKTAIDAAADAAKATVEAAGDAANQASATVASTSRRAARTATKTTKRRGKAAHATAKTARRAKPRRTTRNPRKTAAAAQERIETVTNTNFFNGFAAVPGFAPFQSLFADAGDRGQEVVRRSQKAVEELADLSRANVEALVDAGKIAIEGARAIGQDVVETSRDGVEQAADAVRALAEAKSPTEFIQVQTEFARASFDRFVSESSRLTESVVKLAGEAFQPISTRATLNAERVNKLVA